MALLQHRLAQGNNADTDIAPLSPFPEVSASPRDILKTKYPQAYQVAKVGKSA